MVMKKPRQSLEFDDLDLDSTQDLGIDPDLDHGEEDDEIIDLTDEITETLEESSFEAFESEDLDFGAELIEGEAGGEVEKLEEDLMVDQATILDDDEFLDQEVLARLSTEDEVLDMPADSSLDLLAGELEQEQNREATALGSNEEVPFDFGNFDEEPSVEMMLPGESGVPLPGLAEDSSQEETADAGAVPQDLEALLDDAVLQMEERLKEAVEQMITSRLPELVRDLLREEIDRLKRELQ